MHSANIPAPRLAVLLALCALLAGACATPSPAMRYYLLTPVEAGAVPDDRLGDRTVIVGPLQLPGYLDRPQLMVRLPDGELALRELDRWAEPLDAVLVSTLADNLVRLTGSQRIVTFPTVGRVAADQRVTGRVIRFEADANGLAVLQVQWSIRDDSGRPLRPLQIGEYRAQAAGDESAALVAALSDVLGQFAAELAADLVAAPDGIASGPDG